MERSGRREGFTLIEMAVVLVIIGLIVGGILVGRDLVRAAGIRNTIAQLDRYTAAANTFRTKYDCLPGDCVNAVTLGVGTAGGPGGNGNGDGQVNSYVHMFDNTWGSTNDEVFNFWYHLSRANLIEGGYRGYPAGGWLTFGGDFASYAPATTIRSTFINAMSITDTSAGDAYFGNAFTISGKFNVSCGGLCGGLTAVEAYAFDLKIDDGFPNSGNVQVMYPYYGPRVTANDPGCDYLASGKWIYDLKGIWASWALQIPNTPPNPGQTGCLLAITKRF